MYGAPGHAPNYPAPADEAADPVAEFLANGGQIKTVAAGVRAMDEREVYARASGRDFLSQAYTDRRMREAENQTPQENHHAYFTPRG